MENKGGIIAIVIAVLVLVGLVSSCGGGNNSGGSKTSCGHTSCKTNGPFYCMGKNDTCPNKTYCAYDYYCDACD